jgi:hypothetical protein
MGLAQSLIHFVINSYPNPMHITRGRDLVGADEFADKFPNIGDQTEMTWQLSRISLSPLSPIILSVWHKSNPIYSFRFFPRCCGMWHRQ